MKFNKLYIILLSTVTMKTIFTVQNRQTKNKNICWCPSNWRFGWIVTDLPAKPSVKLRWYRNICLEYYADPGAENGRPFSGRWALGSWTELFYPIIYHVTRRLCPYANDVVSQTLEALRQAPKYAWDLAPLQGLHHVPPVAKCRRHRQACCDILLLYLGHALGEERVERHSGPLLVVRGGG